MGQQFSGKMFVVTPQATAPTVNNDADQKTRLQLNRILASRTFHQGDRLKRFISFIVEETISGRGTHLKEFLVGMEVFGKDSRFDPRTDPIVRVQARRLRARLTRYYTEEGQEALSSNCLRGATHRSLSARKLPRQSVW